MRHKLIVADDNEAVRLYLVEIIGEQFDVVAQACDGMELVAAASMLRPDLLVVDLVMPVLNGLEALRMLSARNIPFKAVIVSARMQQAYVDQAFEAGALGYVAKARAFEDLPHALAAALRGERFRSDEEN